MHVLCYFHKVYVRVFKVTLSLKTFEYGLRYFFLYLKLIGFIQIVRQR